VRGEPFARWSRMRAGVGANASPPMAMGR
jgi:hypothetical protein